MAVTFRANLQGFAQLRSHPRLVAAMESAARNAAAQTPFDVDVVTWPHEGRRSGPRTSVQIWARTHAARRAVNRDPSSLTSTLSRANL
jgi:hypothetical protein